VGAGHGAAWRTRARRVRAAGVNNWHEDQCRVRNRNGVWVLGMFRRLAVSLFAEWYSRDEKRKRATMTDFHAHMSAEHATPAMRFITARYPSFKKCS